MNDHDLINQNCILRVRNLDESFTVINGIFQQHSIGVTLDIPGTVLREFCFIIFSIFVRMELPPGLKNLVFQCLT